MNQLYILDVIYLKNYNGSVLRFLAPGIYPEEIIKYMN